MVMVLCQTFAAVMFEICAFLPDCLSGAVSGQRVNQHRREEIRETASYS